MAVVRMTVKHPAKLLSPNRVTAAVETAEGRIEGEIPAANLGADAVETAKIKDGAVTSAKIADGAVTGGKLASGAVTAAKLATGAAMLKALQQATATGTQAVSSAQTWTDVAGLSLTVTAAADEKVFLFATLALTGSAVAARILRGSTPVLAPDSPGSRTAAMSGGLPGTVTMVCVDTPGAGTHTYKVQVINPDSSGTIYVNRDSSDSNGATHVRSVSVLVAAAVEEAA